MKIPKIEAAWAAGFFDGEGTIRIQKSQANPKSRRPTTYYSLQVCVVQKNPASLDWMRDRWGGSLSYRKTNSTWCLTLKGQHCESFLHDIIPFLQGRKEQAKLALQFRSTVQPRGARPGECGMQRTPDEVNKLRAELRDHISALNIRSDRRIHGKEGAPI